jgi:hypothetical protein
MNLHCEQRAFTAGLINMNVLARSDVVQPHTADVIKTLVILNYLKEVLSDFVVK